VSVGDTAANNGRIERVPVRATKRGDERTPLEGSHDVLICGASFAGLAVARELAGSGADVLIIDRYEIGERQTSACGIPTDWLRAMGLMESERQRFDSLLMHTPHGDSRFRLPFTFSTFDYRELCELLWRDCDARFETAKVNGRARPANGDGSIAIETDRGVISAPLIVDALGWRRMLASGDGFQPPDAPLSRGLEVHPEGRGEDLEVWIDRRYVPEGYGWAFPAKDELRIGIGSFDPRFHVRETTELLAEDLDADRVRYQGNWIPHKIRPGTEGGVFFAGDSAGHCLPLSAEGIRTALYFGIALGRELRGVVDGWQDREQAAARYAEFNDSHEWKFRWMLRVQRLVPRIPPRVLGPMIKLLGAKRFIDWSFGHYLQIAPPDFAERSAHDQNGAGQEQDDAGHALGAERNLV
jgi:flavin-dependent dehydrogenase